MKLIDPVNLRSFYAALGGLLDSPQVQSMRTLPHHPRTNCFEHSIFVAYVAFRLGRRWRLDWRSCARGGLLHDLYLYNSRDRSAHPGNQCLDHPVFALRNASALTHLSDKERNIILSHMWPLGGALPRSLEAWMVDLVDTVCAGLEVSRICRPSRLRERLGVRPLTAAL